MEGMQYLEHRVIDGVYRATMHWKIQAGIVYYKDDDGWQPTNIPVKFFKDSELYGVKG